MPVIAVLIILAAIGLIATHWQIVLPVVLALGVLAALPTIIREIRKRRYFASEEFLAHKRAITSVVSEHNEVAAYAAEIRDRGSFAIGSSTTGSHSHLANFQNTSRHAYRRDRNTASYQASNVHNCSLQVVRNASANPIKYVMKYFGIKADEEQLADVEQVGQDIARLEDGTLFISLVDHVSMR